MELFSRGSFPQEAPGIGEREAGTRDQGLYDACCIVEKHVASRSNAPDRAKRAEHSAITAGTGDQVPLSGTIRQRSSPGPCSPVPFSARGKNQRAAEEVRKK